MEQLTRRQFVQGTGLFLATLPLVGCKPLPEKQTGQIYLYGSVEVPYFFTPEQLRADLHGMAADVGRSIVEQHEKDEWRFYDEDPNNPPDTRWYTQIDPEDEFLQEPQPRIGRMPRRYLQPLIAGFMETGGRPLRLASDRPVWQAFFFLYGRLQWTPGRYPITKERLRELVLQKSPPLWKGVV